MVGLTKTPRDSRTFRLFTKLFSRELAVSLYQGLLERAPDSEGLAAYSTSIRNARRLADILADFTDSEEFTRRIFRKSAPELVRAMFRGILDRGVEDEALGLYRRMLEAPDNVAELTATMVGSEEFRRKFLRTIAPELTRSIFRGLLGTAGSAQAIEACAERLESPDVTSVIEQITNSEEFRERAFAALIPDLLKAIYQGLLDRPPDLSGSREYSALLAQRRNLADVLRRLVNSDEFATLRANPKNIPDPMATYDQPTVVFLHIQKTAGSSLNHLLAAAYGSRNICFRNSDGIYKLSAGELSRYSVFAGHLNYDSLLYVPRRNLSVLCFVREPKKRLLSIYYYWRAHEPTHPGYSHGPKTANELALLPFLQDRRVNSRPEVWNHMTWALMGERKWREWRELLRSGQQTEQVLDEARTAIAKRLGELSFVGLQEDFDRSVDLLFAALGKSRPKVVPTLNNLSDRMNNDPHFKKEMKTQETGPSVEAALDQLLQLDAILYDEAKRLFEERVSKQHAMPARAAMELRHA